MLPVLKYIRAERHRVNGVADFGKNWQGWHYGFKLHASIDHLNRLCAVVFTPASEHDNQVEVRLANEQTKILVGDSHYGGSIQRKQLWQQFRCLVVAPPHYKQRAQLITGWQHVLLTLRPKIGRRLTTSRSISISSRPFQRVSEVILFITYEFYLATRWGEFRDSGPVPTHSLCNLKSRL